jgi:hypothetical protein
LKFGDDIQPFMSLTFQRARSQLEAQVAPKQTGKPTGSVDDDEVVGKLWEILRDEKDLSDVDTKQVRDKMQKWFNTQMEGKKVFVYIV